MSLRYFFSLRVSRVRFKWAKCSLHTSSGSSRSTRLARNIASHNCSTCFSCSRSGSTLAAQSLEGTPTIAQLTLAVRVNALTFCNNPVSAFICKPARFGSVPFISSALRESTNKKAAPALAYSASASAFHSGNDSIEASGACKTLMRRSWSSSHSTWTCPAPVSYAVLTTTRTKSAAVMGALITRVCPSCRFTPVLIASSAYLSN